MKSQISGPALIVIQTVASVQTCLATTLICEDETHSERLLVVAVPASSYALFVKLIESGAIVPVARELAYGGGTESDRVKTWSLRNANYTIGV